MTVTLNVTMGLLVALGISFGLYIVDGDHEARAQRAHQAAKNALFSIPDPAAQERAHTDAEGLAGSLDGWVAILPWKDTSARSALARAIAIRLTLAGRFLLPGAMLFLVGILVGFLGRDHARERVLYRSVTYSYLGKLLALVSLAFGIFVAISPFGPPIWTLYPASGLSAAGAAFYVGNLPPRL